MKFFYGIPSCYFDVTEKVICRKGTFLIPQGEGSRSTLFGDPSYGNVKHILYVDRQDRQHFITKDDVAAIDSNSGCFLQIETPQQYWSLFKVFDGESRLRGMYNYLKLDFGSFEEEYPEQTLVSDFLDENARVLEIGGNIGRNSCIISAILADSRNLVSLESAPHIAAQLAHNRDLNGFKFHIENAALSGQPLVQKGWCTRPKELNDCSEWLPVKVISFEEIQKKYSVFDTFVLDCEGAFYQILIDFPDCLRGINTIIIENDFEDAAKGAFVGDAIREAGLICVRSQSGGWGPFSSQFYQVFKRF